ncbi:hypothetical protein Cgig2_030214 [Carnegiea gigantea]|uniref:Aminotransferase-like plant mobile domain-containing protein n=1 Tax=Carnegiea gigantea TaxID=171969 RepID=A0A9Q1JTF3_9CARY|nr:hypothetical protein Cgig2_030214 [Carnegiea gigantea]
MPFTLRYLFMKNIVPGICEYWCPETNSLHTLKGKVSNSLLDIHGFLGLLLSGFLYDEVVRPSKELKTALERSCNDLFIAFHILRQRFDLKPTIEEWIAFWFCGPVKYHTPMTSGPRSRGMSNVKGSKVNYGKTIFQPLDSLENIMDILDCDPNPTECMGESSDDFLGNDLCLNNSKSICTLNDVDEAKSTPKVDAPRVPPPLRPSKAAQDVYVFKVDANIRKVNRSGARMTGQVILDKVFRTPFKRLYYLKGEFDSLYDLINERRGDATLLQNNVKRLID